MLSLHARRRLIPASAVVSVALTAGLLGATSASAAPAPTTVSTPSAVVVSTATTSTALATSTATAAAVSTFSASSATPTVLTPGQKFRARVQAMRLKAVKVAKAQVGDRYVAGAAGPNRFDCSGLTKYVVGKAYGKSIPHYSRAQFASGKFVKVKRWALKPGDLVFFFKHGAHHVGLYIGNGKMVNATNPRSGVKIDKVFSGWYGKRYSGAARIKL
ncbi:MAG: NlpC/P60 family protein [Actinobacteria bacterium]|nr:NlpC/P60 family protein [Actinomycetota bacterium]